MSKKEKYYSEIDKIKESLRTWTTDKLKKVYENCQSKIRRTAIAELLKERKCS